ncbi:Isoprenylcysteine carboxyl methyltransferase family-domain-containing protein [Dipodascopsis tothii]|uniref:Isoprenylcysteine carboxyl methyltransferase family-domain-containing protein n=1 Tax=Dipodascopsis tothii TaxID=44089 RepID=UPI0034CEF80E
MHAAALGCVGTLAALATGYMAATGSYFQLPAYVLALALFHFLEFWVTARYNPSKASVESFLIRNGASYTLAHACALAEAATEWAIVPALKAHPVVSAAGIVLVVAGQALRTMAMIHAAGNFSHMVVNTRAPAHELVTSGVYALTRHPSYLGYFLWAAGTQVMLLNPAACVGFVYVLWRFFSARIEYEERYLVEFFGQAYVDYRRRVPTRIPFIP